MFYVAFLGKDSKIKNDYLKEILDLFNTVFYFLIKKI